MRRYPNVAGHAFQVHQLSHAPSQQPHENLERMLVLDHDELPHIPLDICPVVVLVHIER